MIFQEYEIGDIVKSRYRSPWTGKVLQIIKRKDINPLVEVLQIMDRHGNIFRKPKIVTMDSSWFKKTN